MAIFFLVFLRFCPSAISFLIGVANFLLVSFSFTPSWISFLIGVASLFLVSSNSLSKLASVCSTCSESDLLLLLGVLDFALTKHSEDACSFFALFEVDSVSGVIASGSKGDSPPHLSSSASSIGAFKGDVITDRRFFDDTNEVFNSEERRCGAAPRLTGVIGGSSLWNCSGLSTGPKDTRFECFLAEAPSANDFLLVGRLTACDGTGESAFSSSSCTGTDFLLRVLMFSLRLPPVTGVRGLPFGVGIFCV